jgi:hypothetical protein
LVAKGAHGLKFGDPIGLPGGTAVSTDGKAVVDISGGRFVFAQFVALVDHEKFLDSGVCDDARVLPLRFSPAQERTRTWASIADDCSSEQFDDWPLAPPRSVPWCLTYLKKEGRRFLALAKVEGSWWGIAEHKELCRYLRLMSLYDQLDVSNLVSSSSTTIDTDRADTNSNADPIRSDNHPRQSHSPRQQRRLRTTEKK